MAPNVTLLDLVSAVAEHARSEAEVVATEKATGSETAVSLVPGMRCRSTRTIVSAGGIARRATPGTLVARRENLGRTLFTVRFDGGKTLILFANEIELLREDLAA